NNLLHSGYYNFSISVPLVFVTIGYWWKRRDLAGRDWRGWIGVNLLLLLVYSCNVLSEGIALMSLVVLAAIHYRERVRRTIALALALVPACILPAYYVATGHGEPAGRSGIGQLGGYLATGGSLVAFDPRERYVGIALAIILAALLGVGLVLRRGLRRRTGGEVGDGRDGFLGLAAATVLLYFLAPARAFGGGSIPYRLALFPPIMVLPWIVANVPGAVRRAAGVAALGAALVHLGFTVEACKVFNRGLAEYTSGISVVAPNSTILPISFDHKGESAKVGVYRHAGSYYCLGNGVIDLANYEGDKSYFPLRYKSSLNPWAIIGSLEGIRGTIRPDRYPRPVDYILLWSAPPQFAVRPWIEANYTLVHSQGRLMIYKRKETSLSWRG
ncbi:MAG TPA: hypothetical protein VMU02_10650, partial [bacterium]|nr:hypothetical protein [bacterium]